MYSSVVISAFTLLCNQSPEFFKLIKLPSSPSLQPLATPTLLFVSMSLTSCKWDHTVFAFVEEHAFLRPANVSITVCDREIRREGKVKTGGVFITTNTISKSGKKPNLARPSRVTQAHGWQRGLHPSFCSGPDSPASPFQRCLDQLSHWTLEQPNSHKTANS